MEIQYLGQNTFCFTFGDIKILTDPAISANPLAGHINVDQLEANVILISHAHGDHCADVEAIAKRNDALIISNYEIASYYGEMGIKMHPMNHGGKWKFDFGTIAMVNAVHSSVFPDGSNGGNACGFILMIDGKSIYIACDTALTMDMKLIPQIYPKLDLAILPIGDNFTMGIDEAIVAAQFVECQEIIGCHFDTFPYIKINHEEALQKFSEGGINLRLLDIGAKITI